MSKNSSNYCQKIIDTGDWLLLRADTTCLVQWARWLSPAAITHKVILTNVFAVNLGKLQPPSSEKYSFENEVEIGIILADWHTSQRQDINWWVATNDASTPPYSCSAKSSLVNSISRIRAMSASRVPGRSCTIWMAPGRVKQSTVGQSVLPTYTSPTTLVRQHGITSSFGNRQSSEWCFTCVCMPIRRKEGIFRISVRPGMSTRTPDTITKPRHNVTRWHSKDSSGRVIFASSKQLLTSLTRHQEDLGPLLVKTSRRGRQSVEAVRTQIAIQGGVDLGISQTLLSNGRPCRLYDVKTVS